MNSARFGILTVLRPDQTAALSVRDLSKLYRADARPEALLALGKLLERAGKDDEVQQVATRLEAQLAVPRMFVDRAAAHR